MEIAWGALELTFRKIAGWLSTLFAGAIIAAMIDAPVKDAYHFIAAAIGPVDWRELARQFATTPDPQVLPASLIGVISAVCLYRSATNGRREPWSNGTMYVFNMALPAGRLIIYGIHLAFGNVEPVLESIRTDRIGTVWSLLVAVLTTIILVRKVVKEGAAKPIRLPG